MVWRFSLKEIESAIQVRILDETVSISPPANALEKDMIYLLPLSHSSYE